MAHFEEEISKLHDKIDSWRRTESAALQKRKIDFCERMGIPSSGVFVEQNKDLISAVKANYSVAVRDLEKRKIVNEYRCLCDVFEVQRKKLNEELNELGSQYRVQRNSMELLKSHKRSIQLLNENSVVEAAAILKDISELEKNFKVPHDTITDEAQAEIVDRKAVHEQLEILRG